MLPLLPGGLEGQLVGGAEQARGIAVGAESLAGGGLPGEQVQGQLVSRKARSGPGLFQMVRADQRVNGAQPCIIAQHLLWSCLGFPFVLKLTRASPLC